MLPRHLDLAEVRVLGAMIEKELSTPDHYPLSLNALVSACNQTSNREPITTFTTDTVSHAIDTLRRQDLVRSFQGSGERVAKYQHLLAQSAELSRADVAVLCVLMLRGPQTMAEVRTRAARLLPGDAADAVESALTGLIAREPDPPVVRLPRRPGQKEVRYGQLLGGEIVLDVASEEHDVASDGERSPSVGSGWPHWKPSPRISSANSRTCASSSRRSDSNSSEGPCALSLADVRLASRGWHGCLTSATL